MDLPEPVIRKKLDSVKLSPAVEMTNPTHYQHTIPTYRRFESLRLTHTLPRPPSRRELRRRSSQMTSIDMQRVASCEIL